MPQVLQSARLGEITELLVEEIPKFKIALPANDLRPFSKTTLPLARALQLNSLAVVAGVGPHLQTSANPKTL